MKITLKNNILLNILLFFAASRAQAMESIELYNHERDWATIGQLVKNNLSTLVDSQITKQYETVDDFVHHRLRPMFSGKDFTTHVIRDDQKIIGFINYRITFDKFLTTGGLVNVGSIELLCVDEQHRKKKLGKKLLDYAMQNLKEKDIPRIQVITNGANEPAVNLYTKAGFEFAKELVRGFNLYKCAVVKDIQ